MSCSQADSVSRADGGTRVEIVNATSIALGCRATAPATIVAMLRSARPNSVRDTIALELARALYDSSFADSVIALVREPQHHSLARRGEYLRMLARFYNCAMTVRLDSARGVALGWITDSCGRSDELRLPESTRARVRAAIDWMAFNDPDAWIRERAGSVSWALSYLEL
jgi:hypothetical protein